MRPYHGWFKMKIPVKRTGDAFKHAICSFCSSSGIRDFIFPAEDIENPAKFSKTAMPLTCTYLGAIKLMQKYSIVLGVGIERVVEAVFHEETHASQQLGRVFLGRKAGV